MSEQRGPREHMFGVPLLTAGFCALAKIQTSLGTLGVAGDTATFAELCQF